MSKKILKFYAEWCGPCKMLTKTLEGRDLGVPLEEIDIDVNSELTVKYGIRGVPTMVYVNDSGEEISRIVGMTSFDTIKQKFNL